MSLVGSVAMAAGQVPPSELARQHLESGIQFYSQERYKQALNDFQIIVTSMADTDYADDALLHIGQYYLEVAKEYDKAREQFETVLQRYPTGDKAPGAYYFLGLAALRSDQGGRALDDALANFQRVIRLYPDSQYVPAALTATGKALERLGRWQEAVDAYSQVVAEYSGSTSAPSAQLSIGRATARLGDPFQGMIELQEVRNAYPDSPEAVEALDFLTLFYRFYAYPRFGRPVSFQRDSSFRLGTREQLEDVEAVRLSTDGIHVLDRDKKRLFSFDRTGQLIGTTAAADPEGLFVDPFDKVVVVNEKGLVMDGSPRVFNIPGDDGPEPLEDIRAAIRDRNGDTYIYDDDEDKVLRFDVDGVAQGPFPDAARREVLRMDLDTDGNIVILDKKDRSVSVYSPEGRRVASIDRRGSKWELDEPVDVSIDPAGYLYVLDKDAAQIIVFDPSYQFVVRLASKDLGGGAVQEPISLDVDRSGALYVYDKETKRVLRLN